MWSDMKSLCPGLVGSSSERVRICTRQASNLDFVFYRFNHSSTGSIRRSALFDIGRALTNPKLTGNVAMRRLDLLRVARVL